MQLIQQQGFYPTMKTSVPNKATKLSINNRPFKSALCQTILGVFLACFFSLSAFAQTCITEAGNAIPLSTPTSQFTDNNDGTVTDTRTGLMWKKCTEGNTGSDCATETAASGSGSTVYTWQQGLALADSSSFAGYEDWRVPNINELFSIVELACSDPAINLEVFPNTSGIGFMSSTPSYIDAALGTPGDVTLRVISSFSGQINARTPRSAPSMKLRLVRGGN